MWMRRAMSDENVQHQTDQEGGLFSRFSERIKSQPNTAPLNLPPPPNPMAQINPMYTRQMAQNSMAPMQMYQNYKQTGQMPQAPSSQGDNAASVSALSRVMGSVPGPVGAIADRAAGGK